jgi:hypothetical protein
VIDLTPDQHKIVELESKLERALNIIENRKRSDAKRTALRGNMERALKSLLEVENRPMFNQNAFNTAARGVLEIYCRLTEIEVPTKSGLILDVSIQFNRVLDVPHSRGDHG